MRQTRLPEVVGYPQGDLPRIAAALNAAEQRLIFAPEAGEEGWYGTWAHAVYNVNPQNPYLPLNRHVARLQVVDVCRRPVNIQNPFYEFLEFGNGYQPKFSCVGGRQRCQWPMAYDRGAFPTFVDLVPGHLVRVRATNPLDEQGGKRVLVQGTDAADSTIYSIDGVNNVKGVFLTLASPFVDTQLTLNALTGIQKDVTLGEVQFADVDPVSGAEVPILTMEPSERIAGYRRYFFNGLPPLGCCPRVTDASGNPVVQVDAIVKLNPVPVQIDPDYLIIQNEEALIAEAQAMRYSTIDGSEAKALARDAHRQAIGMLQGELAHYLGTQKPAVTVKPFGSAALERQRIGTMI